MIVLLLEGSEGSVDLGLLIGLQESLGWGKLNLVFIFLWDFPLVLERDSGIVLNEDGLLG